MRNIYVIKNFAKNMRCAHSSGKTPYVFFFIIIELNLCQIYQLVHIILRQFLQVSSYNSVHTIDAFPEYR